MIPQRGRYTPTRSDIGRAVVYLPDKIDGVLVEITGIFAQFKFKGRDRKFKYASCDVRHLKLIRDDNAKTKTR